MLKEGIIYAGNEYLLDKKIATEKCTYYAYKNEELRKIKFFEMNNSKLEDVKDLEELKKVIDKNYITDVD